jgi:hypothetical protein
LHLPQKVDWYNYASVSRTAAKIPCLALLALFIGEWFSEEARLANIEFTFCCVLSGLGERNIAVIILPCYITVILAECHFVVVYILAINIHFISQCQTNRLWPYSYSTRPLIKKCSIAFQKSLGLSGNMFATLRRLQRGSELQGFSGLKSPWRTRTFCRYMPAQQPLFCFGGGKELENPFSKTVNWVRTLCLFLIFRFDKWDHKVCENVDVKIICRYLGEPHS